MLIIGLLLGVALGFLIGQRKSPKSELPQELQQQLNVRDTNVEVKATLDALTKRVEELAGQTNRADKDRATSHAELKKELENMANLNTSLLNQSTKLAGALDNSQARGKYGEAQLENILRYAGLKEGVDFEIQTSPGDLSGIPDVIVHMAEKLDLYVDSKFPYARYFEAINTNNVDQRKALMEAHANDLLGHVDALSKRKYDSAKTSANFVVLFAPFESILAEALIAKPTLLESAFDKRVVIATPSTLLGMLRTVKLGIDRSALANSAEEIRDIATKLVAKLVTNYEHISTVSKRLNSTVTAFNSLVGNVESTVTAPVKAMIQKGITNDSLPELPTVDVRARDLNGLDSTDTTDAIKVQSEREGLE